MTNISEEQFATLIVPILFALLISQDSSTNKILIKIRNSYGFLLMTKGITILQIDCSSFVCWDNYSVHTTNIISVKTVRIFLAGTVQNGFSGYQTLPKQATDQYFNLIQIQ